MCVPMLVIEPQSHSSSAFSGVPLAKIVGVFAHRRRRGRWIIVFVGISFSDRGYFLLLGFFRAMLFLRIGVVSQALRAQLKALPLPSSFERVA